MPTKVTINFNPQQIILARGLGVNGKAQVFFTNEVKKMSDMYTPMDAGVLKSNVTINSDSITYNSPYARYQWYGVSKNGKAFNYAGSPMRGKEWTNRMWVDRGKEIVKSVASMVGGKAE
jgi:hypothetical protein